MVVAVAHEEWRDIAGYEGYYQVSNLGNVRSLDRCVVGKSGRTYTIRGRTMVPCGERESYFHVGLSKDGKAKSRRVHRLVAETFIPNPDNLRCVNHKDGNKRNNRVDNLEWCTHEQNVHHAIEHKIMTFDHMGYNKWSKESQEHYSKVRKKAVVRSDGKKYECTADAAADLGVSYSAVMQSLRCPCQTCRGYGFTYA